MNIAKGKIGNALTSTAKDHIVVVSNDIYDEEKIKQLTYSLKYELDKSLKQIAEEYDIDLSYLHDINQGRAWKRDYLKYPIRLGKMKRAEIIFPKIKELLINSELSQKEIAQKFNVSQSAVSEINNGKKGYDKNLNYPLRKNYKRKSKETTLSPDIIDEICNKILNDTMSLKEISKLFEETANNEKEHAKIWFKLLGGIGTTEEK